ncbi:MAG: hypothetical protein QOF43_209 [Gaiellaceae bacterium]|jgi:hypothetical protein|nr:hypothetical protein [Gaiellaceae bacterium]
MLRISVIAALCAACVFAVSAGATAPPVGPLPKGPVTSIATPKGQLVSVALPSRSGYSWRLARNVSPKVLVQVSEANVGTSVVIVYRAVGRGAASVKWGLTRGEGRKAYASATFNVRVS